MFVAQMHVLQDQLTYIEENSGCSLGFYHHHYKDCKVRGKRSINTYFLILREASPINM